MAKSYQGSKSRKKSSRAKGGKPWSRENDSKRKGKNWSEEEESGFRGAKLSSLNDLSWYSKNPMLLQAAASFPFPYRPGMRLQLANLSHGTPIGDTIPGVFNLTWAPSFGNSSLPTDPASIAGKEMYSKVRTAYSGSLDADAPDFMVYIGALDSIFSYIGFLKRLYRSLTTYSADNFNLPDVVLQAGGVATQQCRDQLRRDKVRFWQGINELILKSRKFKCPAVMDLFNRHYWMSDNVYADEASQRAQLYTFSLVAMYVLQEQTEVSSGTEKVMGLQMKDLPYFTATAPAEHSVCDTLIEFGDAALRALDSWDDGYTISGYLQRAYDGVPSFIVAELLQDELLTASYVPEVLAQIENARDISLPEMPISRGVSFSSGGTRVTEWAKSVFVTQNVATNAVVSTVNYTLQSTGSYGTNCQKVMAKIPGGISPMLSIRSDAPTVADTVIASRLQGNVQFNSFTSGKVTATVEAGTEMVLEFELLWLPNGNAVTSHAVQTAKYHCITPVNLNVSTTSTAELLTASEIYGLFMAEQFDWHPFCFVVGSLIPAQTGMTFVMPCGDTHNMTKISIEDLHNLNKVCFYSEFNSFSV